MPGRNPPSFPYLLTLSARNTLSANGTHSAEAQALGHGRNLSLGPGGFGEELADPRLTQADGGAF